MGSTRFHLHPLVWSVAVAVLSACAPRVGATGLGDPYYDNLGNGGYDVTNYAIALAVDPAENSISGTTVIDARSSQLLEQFDLDLQGLDVDAVAVDDEEAGFSQQDYELKITPAEPIPNDTSFQVRVDYHGNPRPLTNVASTVFETVGWFHSESGAINVMSEPNGAEGWFPVNDHPRDKATYRFDITVPQPWVVAASGTLQSRLEGPDQTQYVWMMDKPMASYLASVNVGMYSVETAAGPDGVTIRNYLTAGLPKSARENIDTLPDMIAYFSSLFGPYPFAEYGVVIADAGAPCEGFGGALEVQTLSVHCPQSSTLTENILAHELAHQWFGDDVTITNWQDIWLKEGMATYAEWLWQTREGDPLELSRLVARERAGYTPDSSVGNPPAGDIYDWEIYTGGAQVFHALRLQVGDETFFKILRAYLDRFRYGNASTDDFIAVAEEVSGQSLARFFRSWLTQTDLPQLPQP